MEEEYDGHPFTFEVMEVPVTSNFKPLTNLEQYNRLIDPQVHLEGFGVAMLVFGALDTIMCHAFSTKLKKTSL